MDNLLEERVNRVFLSASRLNQMAALVSGRGDRTAELAFHRKDSSICLRRVLALWFRLRWGN